MIKILVNDGIHSDGKLLLEEADYQVDTDKVAQEDLINVLPAYDAIIVRSATKVRKELIDACPNLKVIARGGVGLDNIDKEYAESKGIKVLNTPAASSRAVAELAFAHIFTLARMLHSANRAMPIKGDSEFKALKSSYSKGFQIGGKTLGVIGFGRIGQEAARIGVGLGMNVIATDPYVQEALIPFQPFGYKDIQLDMRFETKSFDEILKKSDFITIHVPFSGGTPLIGAAEFAKMKDGAMLINTSRGGIVDEIAMLAALESGKLAGAGLDVFDNEPKPRKEILSHEKISLTPHTGAETREAQVNIALELADRIIEIFGTKD